MTTELKQLWESLRAEAENRSGPLSPDFSVRLDAAMAPVYELLKAFQRERDHRPFTSHAPCPVCELGTVTYEYKAPLIGSMNCDACEYVKINL